MIRIDAIWFYKKYQIGVAGKWARLTEVYCKVISDCSAHTIKVFSPEEA